jgi:glutamate/tyrosine decarboxylase-like PLP-dependent enzyme
MGKFVEPSPLPASMTDEDEVEFFLNSVFARVKSWLKEADGSEVHLDQTPSDIRRQVRLSLPLEGEGLEGALEGIDDFLRHSVRTHHPNFMNPLWGGFSASAFAGEVISAVAQSSMYTFQLAPIATLIEQEIISRMSEIIGFSDGNGVLTTGGSNGNMLGLLCARHSHYPIGMKTGVDGRNLVMYVSAESHYSVLMAANVLGIGHDNVVKVSTDEDGRMNCSRLEEEIEITLAEGKTPLCIIATSGTTVRGAFDPIAKIAEIANRNGIWLHVDAAWGGACLFSNTHAELMRGVELADSICWDAHKMMGVPLICSAFIIKNPRILRQTCNHTRAAHYLFHPNNEDLDVGHMSLQCGRRIDALKLWLAWKEKGDAGWAKLVDGYVELAAYLEKRVVHEPSLELMSTRTWTNVCFRYNPSSSEGNSEIDFNLLNSKLRDELSATKQFLISRSNIAEDVVLRPVIANPGVTKEVLDKLVSEIVRIGNELIATD